MKSHLQLLLILLILCQNYEAYSNGFGDWSAVTKNGTAFNDPGGGLSITLSNMDEYKNIRKWYFYKNHIIGTRIQFVQTSNERHTCYLIINELNNKVLEFDEEEAWYQYRSEHELLPAYWTRWFSDNWNFMEALFFWIIFLFPLTLLLIYAYFRNIYRALKENEFDRSRLLEIAATPALFLVIYLLATFPGSI